MRDRIHAAREIDPDRVALLPGPAAEFRRSLRADAALRRSIADGAVRRSETERADDHPAAPGDGSAISRTTSAAPRPAAYSAIPGATTAAVRRRDSLNAMARSTRPAADPWTDQIELAHRRRRDVRSAAPAALRARPPMSPTPRTTPVSPASSMTPACPMTPASPMFPAPGRAQTTRGGVTDRSIAAALRAAQTETTDHRPAEFAGLSAVRPDDRAAVVATTTDVERPVGDDDRRGKHRIRPLAAIRRHSTLTLATLIPTGLIGIAGATAGTSSTALLSAHSTELAGQPDLEADTIADPTAAAPSAPATDPDAAGDSGTDGTAVTPAGSAAAGADSYLAAATAPIPTVPVVAQTAPGSAGGPALRNLPDLPTSLKQNPLGVPQINLATYVRAERITAERDPGCNMSWELLAGIGRVESSHANDGKADSAGNLLEPIYGLPLDGSLPGSNVIRDTDGGEYDNDPVYDRAVGPMQFIPQTWKKYATDGTGDGKADPQNLFDAAATTAAYLCDGGLDMRDTAQATRAIMRYNNSRAYATNVEAWSTAYSTGVSPRPEDLPKIH